MLLSVSQGRKWKNLHNLNGIENIKQGDTKTQKCHDEYYESNISVHRITFRIDARAKEWTIDI
jgi:hypothetical protein